MDIEEVTGGGWFRDVYWLVEPERTALAFSEPSCGALYRWYLPAPGSDCSSGAAAGQVFRSAFWCF